MDIPITHLWKNVAERWRTRTLRGDVFHPKRHWYTILAIASAIVCLGGAVGWYEYQVMKKMVAGVDTHTESPMERTEETLGAVLEIYRTRATALSSGSTTAHAVRPYDMEVAGMIPVFSENETESAGATSTTEVVSEGGGEEMAEEGSVMVSP